MSAYIKQLNEIVPADIRGPSALVAKQTILQAFSPRVCVTASAAAATFAAHYKCTDFASLLRPFETQLANEDRGKGADSNGAPSRIVVKFVPDHFWQDSQGLQELYDQSNYNILMEEHMRSEDPSSEVYLLMLNKALSSESVAPFEFFNHPVLRVMVVTVEEDRAGIDQAARQWADQAVPLWVDKETIGVAFMVLADSAVPDQLGKAVSLQQYIHSRYGKSSVVAPVSKTEPTVVLQPTTSGSVDMAPENPLGLPKPVVESLSSAIDQLIYKVMLPYMLRTVKAWNEKYVVPRKSLTGRLLNAGRLWGGGRRSLFGFRSEPALDEKDSEDFSFDAAKGYYPRGAPAVYIRRLADWYLMLRDYRNAYTSYELLKKDFLTDRAYSYLSSLQEFMILSLLLGASTKMDPITRTGTTQGITLRIISDVIGSMSDSSFYSYLSRCNLKTYTIRLTLVVAELFFVLGQTAKCCKPQNYGYSLYLNESQKLFKKLIDSKLLDEGCNGMLMQRVSYLYSSYCDDEPRQPAKSYYEESNPAKLAIPAPSTFGLTRRRKSVLWMLLATRAFDPAVMPKQCSILVDCIKQELTRLGFSDADWPYRRGELAELLTIE